MAFDTTFIVEVATLLFGGGGIAVFLDRKQKKASLELENKQKELDQSQNKESFAMSNIKERYNELEIRHNELVERHKGGGG